jgi:SAM-dependent methyltransferase
VQPGFKRHQLKARYDVSAMIEDDWHAYTGAQTQKIIDEQVSAEMTPFRRVLNAGAGVYSLRVRSQQEVSVDLFMAPIRAHSASVCATIEHLPFRDATFDAIVCVGEVLGYCDPGMAIREFGRLMIPRGMLICDFASSRSPRQWFTRPYGRAADLTVDEYNGRPEKIWFYDPKYMCSLITSAGFTVKKTIGIHTISAVARRIGAARPAALRLQRAWSWFPLPDRWGDITTIVAVRFSSSTGSERKVF